MSDTTSTARKKTDLEFLTELESSVDRIADYAKQSSTLPNAQQDSISLAAMTALAGVRAQADLIAARGAVRQADAMEAIQAILERSSNAFGELKITVTNA